MVNVNKMDKFYEDANDQHVRSTFVYTDGTYAYADAAKTIKIDRETLKNLYLKGEIVGVIVSDDATMYSRPLAMSDNGSYAILVVPGSDSMAGTLSTVSIFSAEYTA